MLFREVLHLTLHTLLVRMIHVYAGMKRNKAQNVAQFLFTRCFGKWFPNMHPNASGKQSAPVLLKTKALSILNCSHQPVAQLVF